MSISHSYSFKGIPEPGCRIRALVAHAFFNVLNTARAQRDKNRLVLGIRKHNHFFVTSVLVAVGFSPSPFGETNVMSFCLTPGFWCNMQFLPHYINADKVTNNQQLIRFLLSKIPIKSGFLSSFIITWDQFCLL